MQEYRVAIENMSNQEREKLFEEFKDLGWKYIRTYSLANINCFACFLWEDDTKPILPNSLKK